MHAASPAGADGVGADLEACLPFLSPAERDQLRPFLSERTFRPDEVVMRDGEAGDFLGILVNGRLAVRKETIFPGRHVLVAFLESGALVGEVAGVVRCQRNTTVAAVEASRLLLLASKDLERLLEEFPALGITLLKRIIAVLGNRLHHATDRLARLL
ncbi:MAG: cyclic nucleotide-binding domain-containing protein [Thermodesulfobacteriota bacterium]